MEVRKGYKRTEVGVIPEDWKVKSYGEIFQFVSTATYSRAQTNRQSEVRYIHYGDIHTRFGNHLEISETELPRVEDAQVKNYGYLVDGDLVMADASEDYEGVGKSVEIAMRKDIRAISGLHTYVLRDTQSNLVNGYRGYLHEIPSVKDQLLAKSTGLKVYGISKKQLVDIQIPLPPTKTEQRAIATALSDADAYVAALEALLAKKRRVKQGVMKEVFTPGVGWREVRLGEVAKVTRGASPRPIKDKKWFSDKSLIGWVRISDATSAKKYLRQTVQKLSLLGIENSRPVDRGSLIMSICATVGRPVITDLDVCIHDGFVVFTELKLDQNYLYYFLTSIEPNWKDMGQTGSQMNLNTDIINNTSIPLPPKPEQTRIATLLTDFDAELTALEAQLTKARAVKTGMLADLLTGRVRLV